MATICTSASLSVRGSARKVISSSASKIRTRTTSGLRCSARLVRAKLHHGSTNPNFPDGANPQFFRLDGIRQSWNSHNGIFFIPRFNGRVPNTQAIVPLEVTDDGTGLQNYDTGLWSDGAGQQHARR